MTQVFKLFILLFFILAFISCNSFRYIDIQVLKPAEISNPEKIDKLYILDVNKVAYNPQSGVDLMNYKLFISSFNTEIEKQFKESPLFENAEILFTSYSEMLRDYKQTNYQERKYINVCSVKRLNIEENIDTVIDYYYNLLKYTLFYKLEVNFYNLLNIKDSLKTSYFVIDTVIWETPPLLFKPDSVEIKINLQNYTELGQIAGEKFSAKIAPFWVTEERVIYYFSNKYMKKAYTCFENNVLNEAIKMWEKVFPLATKRIAGKAAYNIALSYELMDSLDIAQTWAKKSFETYPSIETSNYINTLSIRANEKILLNNQLIQTKK